MIENNDSFSRVSAKSGFTVAEIMIAAAILLIVSSGMIAGMISALRVSGMSSDYYIGTAIARNRIQRARSLAFSSIPMLSETQSCVDVDGNLCNTGLFFRTTTVSSFATNATGVDVKVIFPTGFGRTSSVPIEVQTIIYNGM